MKGSVAELADANLDVFYRNKSHSPAAIGRCVGERSASAGSSPAGATEKAL